MVPRHQTHSMGSDITFGKTQQIKPSLFSRRHLQLPLNRTESEKCESKSETMEIKCFQLLEKGKVIEKATFRDNVLNATNHLDELVM